MTVGEVMLALKKYPLDTPVVTMSDCWANTDYGVVNFVASEKNGLQYMGVDKRTNSKETPCVLLVAAI